VHDNAENPFARSKEEHIDNQLVRFAASIKARLCEAREHTSQFQA